MELNEKMARFLFTLDTQCDALRFEGDFVKNLYLGKANLLLAFIKEAGYVFEPYTIEWLLTDKKADELIRRAGYVKLADVDYKYLPTKECYCYDNGWRKVEA